MRILLDTNRYGDLATRDFEVTERFQQCQEAWLSFISIGELRFGFALGSMEQKNLEQLHSLLSLQGVGILLADEETPKFYASVFVELKSRGTKIPTNDIWIAALALQHDLTLDTRDDHFKQVTGLKLVN